MTEANDRKKYAHLKGLIAGSYKSGNPVRDQLVVASATRNMAQLIKKRPKIQFEEVVEVVKETKSKGKK